MKIIVTSLVLDILKKVCPTANKICFGTDIITIYCDDDVKVLSYCSFHQMMIRHTSILDNNDNIKKGDTNEKN